MTYSASIPLIDSFSAWREVARVAISHGIAPEEIDWNGDAGGLFAGSAMPEDIGPTEVKVPLAFFDLAKSAIWHSDPLRFSQLYTALWRIAKGDGQSFSPVDPLGAKLHRMAKSVRRDIHKMHAFVRFQELEAEGKRRRFIAWFEPEHFVVEPASSFFAKRFADMDWVIATPSLCASFDGAQVALSHHDGKPLLPGDQMERLWGTYFANIFNPARIKLNAMRSEMPVKYWKNMPETLLIPDMLAKAEERVKAMRDAMPSHTPVVAERISTRYRSQMPIGTDAPQSLDELEISLQKCKRCSLCTMATQAVAGRGAQSAGLMIIGEQPGDKEDLTGRPFVGPAGDLLLKTMADAGLNNDDVYFTNAVKHFKFKVQGKVRLHQNPSRDEIERCRWWLETEIGLIKPKVVLALGSSAAYSLTGRAVRHSERRGTIERLSDQCSIVFSWHPSYILRLPDAQAKHAAMANLKDDLMRAHSLVNDR